MTRAVTFVAVETEKTITQKELVAVVPRAAKQADDPGENRETPETVEVDDTPFCRPQTESDNLKSTLNGVYRLLMVLCILAVMSLLYFAQTVLIPVAMSVFLYLLLRPTVRWLQRRHIPEAVGAIGCLMVVVATLLVGIVPLIGPGQDWVEHLPEHLQNADQKLQVVRERFGRFVAVRTQLAEMASTEGQDPPVPVTVQEPELATGSVVLSTTGNMLGAAVVVIVLTFFLLVAGDNLINNLLSILPTFHEKRQTVELILDVQRGISSYLVTITMINVGLGIAITLALWAMGVPNPAVWGLMTTVFNYVPFVGQGVAGLIIGLVALLSFDSIGYALLVPVVFYTIAAIEGNVITPALLGRHMSLNPIMVLLSLLIWGWMWGIAGAALAVPILAMIKIGCERFACTRAVGTLLGG